MKLQDIAFVAVLSVLLFIRKPDVLVGAGLICFLLAIPLFGMWVFFTAERLTWYGACFIGLGMFGKIMAMRKESRI